MSTENISRSVHQRLLNIRGATGEQFNHLLMRYGLERLLYRIQASGRSETFVLKGAMLFALWHDTTVCGCGCSDSLDEPAWPFKSTSASTMP